MPKTMSRRWPCPVLVRKCNPRWACICFGMGQEAPRDEPAAAASLTRRQLIGRGVILATAAVAGTAGCARSATRSTSSIAPQYPVSTADFTGLAERIQGRVLLPGNPGYDDGRVLFNSVYDYVRPVALVQASNAQDVARTIEFASDNAIALVPRSGGHSFAGYSTGQGIVLDVSPMNAVTMGQDGRSARIGSGAKLLDVLMPLAARDRAVPSGFCPTVGIAGVTLGGGIGRLSRMYGLSLAATSVSSRRSNSRQPRSHHRWSVMPMHGRGLPAMALSQRGSSGRTHRLTGSRAISHCRPEHRAPHRR